MASATVKKLRELNPDVSKSEMFDCCPVCGCEPCINGDTIGLPDETLKAVNQQMRVVRTRGVDAVFCCDRCETAPDAR